MGGMFLAVLFFVAREKWFALPDIDGCWHLEMRTDRTVYKPFQDMVLRYVAMLWREGTRIRGTVEKVYENSSTGEREYVGVSRTRGVVEGYIDKRYLSKDRLNLHITEEGHKRQSTHFHQLLIEHSDYMIGSFSSMVADSEGKVTWKRTSF